MKANGRRRWRKWLASQRRRGSDPAASWGRDRRRVGLARRHQGQGWAGWDLPTADGLLALFPRPFSPRSLVGMTMGARKRAANKKRSCDAHLCAACRDVVAALRHLYQVGERLRPCRWCGGSEAFEACRGKRIAQEVVGGHRRGECVFCRTCADAKLTLRVPNPDACDGSGVLPAKARERAAQGAAR